MTVEKIDVGQDPQRITVEKVDCIWVWLRERKIASPLSSRALEWVDWKMRGLISRFIVEEKYRTRGATFIPTMRKLASPYLVLEPARQFDLLSFFRDCDGLKLKEVLIFCEDTEKTTLLESELSKHRSAVFPEKVIFGSDSLTPTKAVG